MALAVVVLARALHGNELGLPDHEKARVADAKACMLDEDNFYDACRILGRELSLNVGELEPDPPRAFALVEKACNGGNVATCNVLPVMAADPHNGATADLRSRATKVHADACARGVVRC